MCYPNTITKDLLEGTKGTIRSAACAIVAKNQGLRILSVTPDGCLVESNAPPSPTFEEYDHELYFRQSEINRKTAYVFFAGLIVDQKERGEILSMPHYDRRAMPAVLGKAVWGWDSSKTDELIHAELNLMYLTVRDMLRADKGWEGYHWGDALRFADLLSKSDGPIPGSVAEQLIHNLLNEGA